MEAGGQWNILAAAEGIKRAIYFHEGYEIQVSGTTIRSGSSVDLHPNHEVSIKNGLEKSHILLLQGRPIDEPVVQYGPFVMNTSAEIQQAIVDYRKTEFGGWPWPKADQTHGESRRRFAKYADGKEEIRD